MKNNCDVCKMCMFSIFLVISCAVSCFADDESGDAIYLNNGRTVSGIISNESEKSVELQISSSSSIVINRAEIKDIRHASVESLTALKDKWAQENFTEEEKEAFEKERQERLKQRYKDEVDSAKKAKAGLEQRLQPVRQGEYPTIKTSEVTRTYFFLTKSAGSIEGYIIFYDKNSRQCAVEGTFRPRLYCGAKFTIASFEKYLDINPSSFRSFKTKGGNTYYGYIIQPFSIEGESVTVNFEWDNITASRTVGGWSY